MIRVFIIDDSALTRTILTQLLSEAPGILVTGSAQDPLFAQKKMAADWPDVIILDLEMPRMDGLTFLKQLMHERPTPVVVCSAISTRGSEQALESLRLGAVEVVEKPKVGVKDFLQEGRQRFIESVRSAAQAKVFPLLGSKASVSRKCLPSARAMSQALAGKRPQTAINYIGIGASTGGTQALEKVLLALTTQCPPILIVQHMPADFTKAFAERLNSRARIHVREAQDGEQLARGTALIAPGGRHMQLEKAGNTYRVSIKDGPPINRHKPSVDVLFNSMNRFHAPASAALLLTGMGNDGAQGLKRLHDAGALTAAQDEASSVVFGMPREAIKLGAADYVLPLDKIAAFIEQVLTVTPSPA